MLKEAGTKLPATKKIPASPTSATGIRNIPLSCSSTSTLQKINATVSLMFLHPYAGEENKKRDKKPGTFVFDRTFFRYRPPGPPRIPLVHWPAP
jgi:hypothetical protein